MFKDLDRRSVLKLSAGAFLAPFSTSYPEKGRMIELRTRPPLLETPFEVFDQGVFTPNELFYVRWHLASIPTSIDPATYQLKVSGNVDKVLSLSLKELTEGFKPVEVVAVNQCAGNSRSLFAPRVAGAQWKNGAMGNARWTGVRLKDVLAKAGVKAGSAQVRFRGLDTGLFAGTPQFLKSLAVDHALDGEVMIAYAMNGAPLPLLNGFPLRLVVPGFFATYWVKMLSEIEVLQKEDENFWMAKAYKIPATPFASIVPGQAGVKMVPIHRMPPRSFFTGMADGVAIKAGGTLGLRGIAFGGDSGVKAVQISADAGKTWTAAKLGEDFGRYSFRRWELPFKMSEAGTRVLLVRTTSANGEEQPLTPNWNASGYMRNVCESLSVHCV